MLEKFKAKLRRNGFEFKEYPNGLVSLVERLTGNCVEFESWDAVMDQAERAEADAVATNHRRDFKVIHGG